MKKSINDFVVAFAAIGIIVSIIMFFCPCVTINEGVRVATSNGSENPFTGIQATFGYQAKVTIGSSYTPRNIFIFSPFNFFTLLLFVAGGIIILMAIFTDYFNKPIFRFVAGVLVAFAGLLMFLMCFLILKGNYSIYAKTPAWGSIVGGVFGILNGAMLIAYNARILFAKKNE